MKNNIVFILLAVLLYRNNGYVREDKKKNIYGKKSKNKLDLTILVNEL